MTHVNNDFHVQQRLACGMAESMCHEHTIWRQDAFSWIWHTQRSFYERTSFWGHISLFITYTALFTNHWALSMTHKALFMKERLSEDT